MKNHAGKLQSILTVRLHCALQFGERRDVNHIFGLEMDKFIGVSTALPTRGFLYNPLKKIDVSFDVAGM